MIEIKSSLINSDEFKFLKESLINASEVDGKDKFRVKLIEYINDSSDDSNDEFFYDMLEFARFLHPSANATAFTTPDKLIYLNAPCNGHGEDVKEWDFIYDHECLHQLWDTWGVEKRIEKDKGSCDHDLLNYASDCVINDYLGNIRKKKWPSDVVSPEYIEKTFGVKYDNKKDTQYTLYMKMLEKIEEIKKDPNFEKNKKQFEGKISPKKVEQTDGGKGAPSTPQGKHSEDFIKGWTDAIQDVLDKKVDPTKFEPKKEDNDYNKGYNAAIDNIKEGVENGLTMSTSSDSSSSQGSDLPDIPWDLPNQDKQSGDSKDNQEKKDNSDNSKSDSSQEKQDNDDSKGEGSSADEAKKDAEEAQDAADKAEKSAKEAQANGDEEAEEKQEAAEKAKEEAAKAKDAAKKAEEAEKKGNKKEAAKAAKEAAEAAANAKKAAEEAGAEIGDGKIDKKQYDPNKKFDGTGGGTAPISSETDTDLEELRKKAEEKIKEYREKIAGDFGRFIKQCKYSAEGKKNGLSTGVEHGTKGAAWNQKMNRCIMNYVKNKVFKYKRLYKKTYKRVRRGSGPTEAGKPIEKGKIIRNELLTINAAFYIDRSGSMDGNMDNVFDACYIICEALKKQFSKEKVVSKIGFKLHAFDTQMHEIKFGKRVNAGGSNMSFHEILQYIEKHTNDFLINIIITDGYYDMNETEIKKFLKNIRGMVVYVVNNQNSTLLEKISKERDFSNILFYIEADSSFKIDTGKITEKV